MPILTTGFGINSLDDMVVKQEIHMLHTVNPNVPIPCAAPSRRLPYCLLHWSRKVAESHRVDTDVCAECCPENIIHAPHGDTLPSRFWSNKNIVQKSFGPQNNALHCGGCRRAFPIPLCTHPRGVHVPWRLLNEEHARAHGVREGQ